MFSPQAASQVYFAVRSIPASHFPVSVFFLTDLEIIRLSKNPSWNNYFAPVKSSRHSTSSCVVHQKLLKGLKLLDSS